MSASLQSGAPLAWFHDPPSRGTWNMALDEALLHRATEGGPPTLRFYQWDAPTLSLGYFQRYSDRASHAPSAACAAVRRTTGGGAILHDRELTYSLTLPSGHWLGRRSSDLYYAVHQSVIAVLAECGLAASLHACEREPIHPEGNAPPLVQGCGANERLTSASQHQPPEPFLCFERRTAGDIVLNGQKICGSAQRRHKGAVLQHGSVLFERSPFAPQLPGICDFAANRLDYQEFAVRLRNVLSDRLGFGFAFAAPSSEIKDWAAAIERSKFSTDVWLRMR